MSFVARDHAGDAAAPEAPCEPAPPARSVAADMAAIFAALPRTVPDPPPGQGLAAPAGRRRSRRWLQALLFLAVAIAGGLFVGLTIPRLPTRVAASVRAVPRSVPGTDMSAQPRPAPPAAVAPPPEPVPAEPVLATPLPKRTAIPTRRTSEPAAVPTRPSRAGELSRDDCHDEAASLAWCLRGASLAADDRLRDAYAEAGRAHVDRAVLVAIRKDWSRLRRRAIDDPDGMIRGYAGLTDDLQRLTREARSR